MKSILVLLGITHCIFNNKKKTTPFFVEEIEILQKLHQDKIKKNADYIIQRFVEGCRESFKNEKNMISVKLNIENFLFKIKHDSLKQSIKESVVNFFKLFTSNIEQHSKNINLITTSLYNYYDEMYNRLVNDITTLFKNKEINALVDLDKIKNLHISNDHYSTELYLLEQFGLNKKLKFDEYCIINPFEVKVIEKGYNDDRRNYNTLLLQKLIILTTPDNFDIYIEDLCQKNKVLVEYYRRTREYYKNKNATSTAFANVLKTGSIEKIGEFIRKQVEIISLNNNEIEILKKLVQMDKCEFVDEYGKSFNTLKHYFECFVSSYTSLYDEISSFPANLTQLLSNVVIKSMGDNEEHRRDFAKTQTNVFMTYCLNIFQLICDTDYKIREEIKVFCDVFDFEDVKRAEFLRKKGYGLDSEKLHKIEERKINEAKIFSSISFKIMIIVMKLPH